MPEKIEHLVVECSKCEKKFNFQMGSERLRERLDRLRRERMRLGFPLEDLREEYLLDLLGCELVQCHKCAPSEEGVINQLIEEVRDGQRFGAPYTIRSLCRALAGKFPGFGRMKLEKLVRRLLEDGKLLLEDGMNANWLKVRYLALGGEVHRD